MNVNNAVYEITKLIANYKELAETIRETEDVRYKKMLRNMLNSRYGKFAKHE